MKKFYSFLALMLIGSSVVSAQTFPCGDADLNVCPCPADGTLVADSEPCTFDSGTSQQVFILVDVNDATVGGDADDNSVVATSTTGTFTNVPTGDYVAYQVTLGLGDEVNPGDDLATILSNPNVASGLATVNGPECDCPDYALGNFVWWDKNLDGNLDTNEPGIPNVTVNLYNTDPTAGKSSNALVGSTTTDANGYYSFSNLDAGSYWVEILTPAGYYATGAGSGDNGANNTNDFPDGPISGPYELTDAESTNFTIDAGFAFDSAVCESFIAEASILAQADGTYKVVVTLEFGSTNVNGFMVSSPNGFNGETSSSFIDGNFANGTGFSYTITSLDIPGCSIDLTANTVDISSVSIELARFEATATEAGNQIDWITATETNNEYFTVEYSTDGVNFAPIAKVNGAGTTGTNTSYSFLHDSYKTAVSYYRLSQTDFDGTTKYVGNIERVERAAEVLTLTNVFPVPASSVINLEFIAANAGQATVNIFDLTGKLVSTSNVNATKGSNATNFDISALATGTYFVNITIGSEQVTAKFVKN